MNKAQIKKLIPEELKKQLRLFKSFLAALYYGFPSRKLKIIGVTGTSGKSTTAAMIYHILNEAGYNVGVVTTIGAKVKNKILDTGFHVTTPDPVELQKILKYMVKKGAEYVVLETSSHALAQGRIGFTKFNYSVFTNIKRDHLDWHKTWENYARAKATLIDKTMEDGTIIINRGDKDTYDYLSNFIKDEDKKANLITYSTTELTDVVETVEGINFVYSHTNFLLPVLGRYNLENALAAINTCSSIGMSYETISKAFSTYQGLQGRMEIIQKEPFLVIVNFAHNTDSLEKSLSTARNLIAGNNRIIIVFGSAGLRDIEKRYTMGEAAAKLADYIVITAEDPRTESLEKINSQILEGVEKGGGKLMKRLKNHEEYLAFVKNDENYKYNVSKGSTYIFDEESTQNRFDAIDFAIKLAKEGDVVITEGKGHEKSLCFGTTEYPFTDQEATKKALGLN